MSSRSRILYVDDDRDSLELVSFMLDTSGADWIVTTVESAKEALPLIERESFDLYIFDYRMAEVSGIELCRFVRRINPDKPVLFFSGMARSIDVAEGLNAGANEYLVKPGDLEKLTPAVKRLLDESLPASVVRTEIEPASEQTSLQKIEPGKLAPVTWRAVNQKPAGDFSKTRLKKISRFNNKIKGKRFGPNQIQRAVSGKLSARKLLAGTAVFSIIVLHFFTQFIYLRDERIASNTGITRSRQDARTKTEKTPLNEIKKESEEKKNNLVKAPEKASPPVVQREPEFAPSRTVIRKKVPRETRAERLRRAEKLLTGV